jgi:hypothetical protein
MKTETMIRSAIRLESAQGLLANPGYEFDRFATFFIIRIEGEAKYSVEIEGMNCTCMDFHKFGDFCKHTIACDILLTQEHAMNADAERYANAEDVEFGCSPL